VKQLSEDGSSYSDPDKYWYNPESGTVYDYKLHFPIGKIAVDNNIQQKLDKDTYIINRMIPIPIISNK
jgi:hypothetical protein